MRKYRFSFITFLSLIIISNGIYSGYDSIFEIGLYGGISGNEHKVDFYELPGFPNYGPIYNSSNSVGLVFGISSDYKILDFLSIGLNAGILPISSEFNAREFIGNQELNGTLVHVYSNHLFKPELTMLNFFPNFKIYPFKGFEIYLSVGLNLGIFVYNKATQMEFIDDDLYERGIEFTDGTNSGQFRNVSVGPMIINNSIFALTPGLGYKFNLNERLKLGLSGNFNLWIMDITPQNKWELKNSELSLNLSYSVFGNEVSEPQPITLDEEKEPEHQPVLITEKSEIPVEIEQAVQQQTKPEPKQETIHNKECCYIIFSFNENKQKIQKLMLSLNNNNINDLMISEYYDAKDNITYYRLRSNCFSDAEHALIYYQNVMANKKLNSQFSNYYIKCDEK